MLTIYEERGIIKGKRDALLKQLRFKSGDVPEAVVAKVQAIDTEAELDALLERVLQAMIDREQLHREAFAMVMSPAES